MLLKGSSSWRRCLCFSRQAKRHKGHNTQTTHVSLSLPDLLLVLPLSPAYTYTHTRIHTRRLLPRASTFLDTAWRELRALAGEGGEAEKNVRPGGFSSSFQDARAQVSPCIHTCSCVSMCVCVMHPCSCSCVSTHALCYRYSHNLELGPQDMTDTDLPPFQACVQVCVLSNNLYLKTLFVLNPRGCAELGASKVEKVNPLSLVSATAKPRALQTSPPTTPTNRLPQARALCAATTQSTASQPAPAKPCSKIC